MSEVQGYVQKWREEVVGVVGRLEHLEGKMTMRVSCPASVVVCMNGLKSSPEVTSPCPHSLQWLKKA